MNIKFGAGFTYKELLEKNELCNSDEQYHQYSINTLFDELGEFVFEDSNEYIADIFQTHKRFIVSEHKNRKTIRRKERIVFSWEEGRLYGHCLKEYGIQKKEYMYIHFQKRKMTNAISGNSLPDKWIIIPNKICDYTQIDEKFIKTNSRENLLYKQWYKSHLDGALLRIYRYRTGDYASCEIGDYKK